MRGSEVQVVPRMPQEPRPNFLGLVGGIVVQHQMDGKIRRYGTIDLIQEFAELDGAMAWPALTDHRSRGNVQRSEETGGAMALVIMSSTLHLAGQHGKDWLATAQRLNLTLLIHAQHQRMMRRVQVQADDVAHLVDQQRIVGELKRLAAMRTQPEGPPDATHRGLTHAGPRRQRAAAPMRCSFGSLFQGQAYGPLNAVIADLSWRSWSHLVSQTSQALGDKTIPPHAHRKARGVQLVGHGSVVLPTDTFQNDAGAKG